MSTLTSNQPRNGIFQVSTLTVAGLAGGALLVAGAYLWSRHGMTIYLDRLAVAVWSCF